MIDYRALAISLAAAGAIVLASDRPASAQWYGYSYPSYSYGYGYPAYSFGYGYPSYSAAGAFGGPYVTPAPEFAPGAYHVTYPNYYSYSFSYPGYWYNAYPSYYYRPGRYSFFRTY